MLNNLYTSVPSPSPAPHSLRIRRGGQPRNQNARKTGTFSLFHPGPLYPTRLRLQTLRASIFDPAVSPDCILDQAHAVQEHLFRSNVTSDMELFHTALMVEKTISLVRRVNRLVYPALRRTEAIESFARDPLIWVAGAMRDYAITRDADSFFSSAIKSAQNTPLPASSRGGNKPPPVPVRLPPFCEGWASAASVPLRSIPVGRGAKETSRGIYPPPGPTNFSTNLTDSQWAALAPLIPPDPYSAWLEGEPPAIIAANRWHFTRYVPTGDFQEFVVMERYHQTLQRVQTNLPSLAQHIVPVGYPNGANPISSPKGKDLGIAQHIVPVGYPEAKRREGRGRPPAWGWGRGRGRPRTSPRLLLDAIFWKFATGHPWDSLPACFPPMRICRKYYRRLYRSGRWFTLLLALFNHFEREASTDLPTLLENDIFTATPSLKLALRPHVPLTWENCTALLFMQLALSAWSHLHHASKQDDPSYRLPPVFRGPDPLTTGLPPGVALPPPSPKPSPKPSSPSSQEPSDTFLPSEESPAWKKWLKLEQDQQTIARELNRRFSIPIPPAPWVSSSPLQVTPSSRTNAPPLSAAQDSGGVSPGNAYNQPMLDMTQLSEDYTRIARAIRYIEANAPRQPDLNELAAQIGLSEYHFQRLFTRWAGISPKRFLQFLTRENAKALLANSASLLDATYAAGLSSPGRLHDLFVQTEAVTPGEYKTKGSGVDIAYGFHPSPFGECLLALTGRGICFLAFVDADHPSALEGLRRAWPNARQTELPARTAPIVERIFSPGSLGSLPLHLRGTNFQIKVWEALLRLPPGRVTTYQALAEQLYSSGTARALGNALAHNPVAYLIPCHRVLQKTGHFGNYRYGSTRKKAILAWEMARTETDKAAQDTY